MSFATLKKSPDGFVPVIVQDVTSNEVLMFAYMNEEAYEQTLSSRQMTYYSRSRGSLWTKGETSGHYQTLHSLTADCDKDTLLAKVHQTGVACHTGEKTCFFQEIISGEDEIIHSAQNEKKNAVTILTVVMDIIADRKANPKEGSYTNYLFDKGLDKILKKLGEEATEIVIAAKNGSTDEVTYETADFLYHLMVLMTELDISWDDVLEELAKR
jgi:phosphoribosyl-ATP pyrophosphohydrolase/phosphoribosyl-AMP cyclohydrolase